MKVRTVAPARWRLYWRKSKRFASAAESSFADGLWDPAISSAVHAAISAIDALTVARRGERSAGDDHGAALQVVRRIEDLAVKDCDAIDKSFGRLLRTKNLAEYVDALCDQDDATMALDDLRRLLPRIEGLLPAD